MTISTVSDGSRTMHGIMESFDGTRKYSYGDKYVIYRDYFNLDGEKYDLKVNIMELSINDEGNPYNSNNIFFMNPRRFSGGFFIRNNGDYSTIKNIGGYVKFRVELLKNGSRVKNVPINFAVTDLDRTLHTSDQYFRGRVYYMVNSIRPVEFIHIDGFTPNKSNSFVLDSDPDVGITPKGAIVGMKNDVSAGYSDINSAKWKKKAMFFKDNLLKDGYFDFTFGSTTGRTGNVFNFDVGSLFVKYKIDHSYAGSVNKSEEYLQYGKNVSNVGYTINDGYRAKYWTCDQDVEVNYKTVTAGNPIMPSELSSIKAKGYYTFTLHTEKAKGGLKIIKSN